MVAGSSEYRPDEIDRRIVHALMVDARNTSSPAIAEEVSVTDATIRNRIARLEELGIVTGYHAAVDFERADGRLTNLFMCNVAFADLERVAQRAGTIPGVINVRELMGGRLNLHVLAVGENTADLRRIGRDLSEIGARIEDEMLVQDEHHQPYTPYGPQDGRRLQRVAEFTTFSGGAEVVELTVEEDAPIAGLTVEQAARKGLFDEETLVVAIERDDAVITPHGHTTIRARDLVTVFSRGGADDSLLRVFHARTDRPDTHTPNPS